jgi:type VI secretion system protein ImpH
MHQLEKYRRLISKLPFDIKAEVLLAEMIEDVHADEIEIACNSVFARNVHYDIDKVEETEYPTTKKRRLRFVLNRDGLYDFLPEDLFHQSIHSQPFYDKERMMADIKVQEQREQAARKFFLPYEQEFFRLRIKLETEERKFMFANSGKLSTDLLSRLWNLPDFLSEEQKLQISLMMPVMHRLVGNYALCSFLATEISGDEVTISEGYKLDAGFADDPRLGEVAVGAGLILGGDYQSMEPNNTWKIKVRDVSTLSQYMPGGKKASVHQYLSNLMIPLENDVHVELDVSETSKAFVIGEESLTGMLGYETYL